MTMAEDIQKRLYFANFVSLIGLYVHLFETQHKLLRVMANNTFNH